jgi:hypothetical protein
MRIGKRGNMLMALCQNPEDFLVNHFFYMTALRVVLWHENLGV